MKRLLVAAWLLPAAAFAQQQPPPQQYPPGYYYPPPQQYPPGYYYPPPQQYPQAQPDPRYGYPPAPQPRAPQAEPPPPSPPPRLKLQTQNEAAAADTWACASALDHGHLAVARTKCGEALAKDDTIALAHLYLAQAQAPDLARVELKRAVELARRASPGERYFVEAFRAEREGRGAEARRLYDQLVQTLPGEPRAALARARFRQALGDLDGALADAKRALELDPKADGALALQVRVLTERGQLDEAMAAAKQLLELRPTEPNAFVLLARVHLRKGETAEALAAAKKAVAQDDKFPPAHAAAGDALLFSGKTKDARKAYGVLIGTDDPAVHHAGAMREARSWLFEGRGGEAEKALAAEANLAEKTKRPGDQADALVELARLQLDRGAVTDAGQTLRQVGELLTQKELHAAIADEDRRRLATESAYVRAMVLAAVGERQLAEQRAEDVGAQLKAAGDPRAAEKTTALRGWIAARNRDDKSALVGLAVATRPTLRLALALAAVRASDQARARSIMEELAKRTENDLETALTRPRAAAWLRAQK